MTLCNLSSVPTAMNHPIQLISSQPVVAGRGASNHGGEPR